MNHDKPKPGTEEAIALGCNCYAVDIDYGDVPPYSSKAWKISDTCPVHSLAARRGA